MRKCIMHPRLSVSVGERKKTHSVIPTACRETLGRFAGRERADADRKFVQNVGKNLFYTGMRFVTWKMGSNTSKRRSALAHTQITLTPNKYTTQHTPCSVCARLLPGFVQADETRSGGQEMEKIATARLEQRSLLDMNVFIAQWAAARFHCRASRCTYNQHGAVEIIFYY